MELVHKRQHGAVPIVVQGARFHRVNGCYEPVDEVSQLFITLLFYDFVILFISFLLLK